MHAADIREGKQIYRQLCNVLNDREKINKTFNMYITLLDYSDKTLLILFICYCCQYTYWNSKCQYYSSVFIRNGILKIYSKTTGRKRNNPRKMYLLTKSKLSGIEKIKPKVLTNTEISDKEFILVSNDPERQHKNKKQSTQ